MILHHDNIRRPQEVFMVTPPVLQTVCPHAMI
jgi:hypothetical protein